MPADFAPTIPRSLANVPAFPAVALRLLSLLSSPEARFRDVAACIVSDPVLSGRLLKRANAADVGVRSEVRTVLQAILTLGFHRTREIVLTTATFAYLGPSAKLEQSRHSWHHTVACAVVASEISRYCDLPQAESYTAGLLHDVGRLALLNVYASEYADLLAHAVDDGAGLLSLEREHFGTDHAEAGRWLAQAWNLPDSIAEVAGNHHDAPTGTLDTADVVRIACPLASLLGFSVGEQAAAPSFDEIAAVLPGSVRETLFARLPSLQAEVAQQISFIGDGAPAEVRMRPLSVRVDAEEEVELASDYPQPQSVVRPSPWRAWLIAAAVAVLPVVAYWFFRYRP